MFYFPKCIGRRRVGFPASGGQIATAEQDVSLHRDFLGRIYDSAALARKGVFGPDWDGITFSGSGPEEPGGYSLGTIRSILMSNAMSPRDPVRQTLSI